ncbi:MAG: TIGR00375 family protein [Candidatus Thermoplasmatota archaeon]
MIINADLHIHSRYAGATSDRMTIENIAKAAPGKGLDIVGTGDCLHPLWLKEIENCEKVDEGTFEKNNTRFVLTTEIEAEKRVHHLLFFPSLSKVKDFKEQIKNRSKNLDRDGRPNVNMSGEKLAEAAKDVDALIGPSHAFTPWTAIYAYYDSLRDCYGDMSDYVSFLELGLSADSYHADKIEELHHLTFLSNSDCHSPHPVRLGREFNRFKVKDVSFNEIKKAVLRRGGRKPILNVGLPPEEGKYHESACRSCYTHFTLKDAIRRRWRCSCGKQIKKGVQDQINEKADFEEPEHPDHRPNYVHLIPLSEIITKAVGQRNPFTKTVSNRWKELIDAFSSEINVLLEVDINKIVKVSPPAVTRAIKAFRENKVIIIPGGGGEYGKIHLPEDKKAIEIPSRPENMQTCLSDF